MVSGHSARFTGDTSTLRFREPYVVARYCRDRVIAWRAIESHLDLPAAYAARRKLVDHELRVGCLENPQDIKVFRTDRVIIAEEN